MELIKKNIHMDYMKCKAATQITLEDDINVSDNKPDIMKMIFDKGMVQIEEMKVSTDHVQVTGKLKFAVLYISEDNDKKVCTIDGSLPFNEQVYLEGVKNGDPITIKDELEDLTIGLINSRKLSVQAVIGLKLCVEELYDEETAVDIMRDERMTPAEPIEYRKKTMEVSELAIQKKDVFRMKEEVQIPQSLPNIFELLWEKVCVDNVEFKAMEEKISIQGEMSAFFLYEAEGEDQSVRWHETIIPFSGMVECHGCKDCQIPDIDFAISHLDVEVRPDFDGEERVIGIELVMELQIKLYEQEQVEILADVYGIQSEVNTVTKEGQYKNLLIRNSGKVKVSEHIKIQTGGARILQLCHSEGEAQLDEAKIVENGIEITGSVLVKILYITNDDAMPFCATKGMMPFKHVIDVPDMHNQCDASIKLSVEQLNVAMIDSEEIDAKLVLNVNATVFCGLSEKIITDIHMSELDSNKLSDLPGIVVYIAKEGDTLWQIGKKYYVPITQIRETNALASDNLKAGDKLLVVKTLTK